MKPTTCSVLLVLLLALLLSGQSRASDTLHVFHTNDTQGRLQRDFDEGDGALVGGMARIVRLLTDLRQRHGEALYLDAGDALGAAALSEFDGGRLMVELLSSAGLDVAAAGNHEFDYGLDTLRLRAQQAGFHFVGSNIDVPQSPLQPWVVVERGGRRIGVIGLIDPGLSRVINKERNPGLVFTDPQAALDRVVPALADSVDLIIALAHMSVVDAMKLAARNPAVPLWIVGPGSSPEPPHDVQLASGSHVIATPGSGMYVGHIEICWPATGMPRGTDVSARLVPVTAQLPVDEAVLMRIAAHRGAFERSRQEALALVTEPIDDAVLFVADLIRTKAHAEVGIVNRGTFRAHTLAGQLTLADVDRLVRYEDNVVVIELTGTELKNMAARSGTRERSGQQLVFSGFDPVAKRIDGRTLHNDEVYRVVTTQFLAAGGDDYLKNVKWRNLGGDTPVTLSGILVEHLRAHPTIGPGTGIATGTGRTWKNQTKWSGSMSRTGVSSDARRYSGVSFLRGSDAMTWNSIVDSRWTRESATGTLALNLRSTFGQVRENEAFRESADRLQLESVYSWDRFQPAPFLSTDINSVWTVPSGAQRPVTIRASAGVQRPFASSGKVRVGLGLERDVASGGNEVGVELVPEYRLRLGRANAFSTSLKIFAGATETRKISAQQYNNLLINLRGNLYVTVDASFFFHRDDVVGDAGLKSEVQIGFGYTMRGKWI